MASHVSILVTGERDMQDESIVHEDLDYLLSHHAYDSVALYVGCCPTGADKFARDWWREKHGENAICVESRELEIWTNVPGPDIYGEDDGFRSQMFVFKANWYPDPLRPKWLDYSAGPKRNGRMVRQFNEDYGLFPRAYWSGRRERRNKSGTLDCMEQLAQLGIEVALIPTVRRSSWAEIARKR
jgi:hypothetical protein